MSENQDKESPVTDSQETFYEKSQNIVDSQMLNESQDFALIVGEDSDESAKNQSETVENNGDNNKTDDDPIEKDVLEAETEGINHKDAVLCEIEKESQHILTQVDATRKNEPIESSNTDDDEISKEKRGSDEDEIIQGTPPEISSSPSRKLLSGKRKGESIEEPVSKIQRTLSQRDALKLEKEGLASQTGKACVDYKLILSSIPAQMRETQSDIICENTEHFEKNEDSEILATQSHPRNIIIEETQDLEDSEPPINFGNTSEDDNGDAEIKSKESGEKNKNSVDQCDSQLEKTDNKLKVNEKENPQPTDEIVFKTSDDASEPTSNGKNDHEITEDDAEASEVANVTDTDLAEKKICNDERTDNENLTDDKEFFNVPLPSSDSASDSNCEGGSNGSNNSRRSVELIYDGKSLSQERKKAPVLVKIDEDGEEIVLDSTNEEGEKIVLDSSTEEVHLRFSTGSSNNSPQNTTVYKSCMDSKSNSESSYKSTLWNDPSKRNDVVGTPDHQLTNGDEEGTMSGTTKTVSSGSDQLMDDIIPDTMKAGASKSSANDSDIDERFNLSSKLNESIELANAVSDSEGDSHLGIENMQSKSQDNVNISSNTPTTTKTTVYENKIRFQVEIKYLVHIDDNTKEIVYKEVTDVQCDPLIEPLSGQRNSDTSGCLADISGNANKDTSPGSVLSNPQLFQLPMSRFSTASTISSSSSLTSAASLAAKSSKDVLFSLPKGRAKHAKRPAMGALLEEKLNSSESYDKITQGWKNAHLITDTIILSANGVINLPEIFQHDTEPGKSEDKVLSSTPEPGSTEENVLSSTPEPVQDERVTSQLATPKSTKDKKPLKRSRTKSNTTARSGKRKASPEVITTSQEDRLPISKRRRDNVDIPQSNKLAKEASNVSTPSRQRNDTPRLEALRSLTPQNLPSDELVGKVVFAKWSDNNYYPGKVTEKTKSKFRVKFYDGQTKLLIEEFIIPMPKILREGLSIYATTAEDDYGSMGIILESEDVNNEIYYTVAMDNGKKVKVQTKDIFLMQGQAQILKEEVDIESKSLPKTPQHLGEVSLNNLMDRTRRPPVTPTVSTPKSRKTSLPRTPRIANTTPASGSGILKAKGKPKDLSSSESDTKTSDSNVSSIEDVDGVQPELVIIPAVQISKGPASRMKGRGRSKSKQTQDDVELGPMPPASSTIFKNMSFILTSTSSDIISRHNTDDSCSEAGTENEEEWLRTPFVKDRVKQQLISGGGTVYDSFKLIPQNEYKNTKLITNAPNLTAKSIQCLSVGISVYRHTWVIDCCRENKSLLPSGYELPIGWSLEKHAYVESYDRLNKQPFNGMIIGMPMLDNRNVANRSIEFWRRICENAGAKVQVIGDPETEFSNATAILTDNRCPSWLVEKADSWQIPLLSTVWIIQCIISGESLPPDTHPQYKHTFIQS